MTTETRAPSTCLTVLVLVSILGRCSSSPAEDPSTRDYLQESSLPERQLLASRLLSLLAMPSQTRPSSSYLQPEPAGDDDTEQLELSEVLAALRPVQKRGLGQCIHNCINGRGNMNFIQCKSMCH